MYDKELLQIVIACTMLFGVFAFFLVWFVIRYKNQKQQYSLEKQRLLFELEKKELRMGFEERELVLSEISQDIHDNVGQLAHLIRMNLHTIEQYSNHSEQLALIKYVSELIVLIINDTRYLGQSLNSNFIKGQGLYRMLEYDTERINASKQIHCAIEVEGKGGDRDISAETQLLIYRIAQEAIHNVLEHAGAGQLEILLVYDVGCFKMVIKDDGIGFNEAAVQGKGTMGICNMYQRAKLLNGELNIDSQAGAGCTITLSCLY